MNNDSQTTSNSSQSSGYSFSNRPGLGKFFQISPREFRDLFSLLKRLVKDPQAQWQELHKLTLPNEELLFKYFFPMLVLAKVCVFFGWMFTGGTFIGSLFHLIVDIALSFVFIFIGAYILKFLAPKFEGKAEVSQCMVLLVFTWLPALAAQLLCIFPYVGFLGYIFGLYSFFVYLQGISPMLGVPRTRRTGFFFVSLIFMGLAFGLISYVIQLGLPPVYRI